MWPRENWKCHQISLFVLFDIYHSTSAFAPLCVCLRFSPWPINHRRTLMFMFTIRFHLEHYLSSLSACVYWKALMTNINYCVSQGECVCMYVTKVQNDQLCGWVWAFVHLYLYELLMEWKPEMLQCPLIGFDWHVWLSAGATKQWHSTHTHIYGHTSHTIKKAQTIKSKCQTNKHYLFSQNEVMIWEIGSQLQIKMVKAVLF